MSFTASLEETPGQKDTALPPGWATTTLGEIVRPSRPRQDPRQHPDLSFIGMEHVQAHSMRLLGTVPAASMNSSAVHFQPGDVLYGRLRPYLNKVYRPDFEGLCSGEFIVLPGGDNHSSRFLAFLLNSSAFVDFASHLDEGDRPRVDFQQIAAYPVNVPPLPEQHRIVAEIERHFSLLDAGTAHLRRVQTNLRRYRASVLQDACAGRLVPTEAQQARAEGRDYEPADRLLARILAERRARWETDQLAKMEARETLPISGAWKARYPEPAPPDTAGLADLPEGWVWATVDQVADKTLIGLDRGRDVQSPIPVLGQWPYVKMNNITMGGRLIISDLVFVSASAEDAQRYKVEPGDLLFNTRNSVELVGKVAIAKEVPAGTIYNSNIMRLRLGGVKAEFVCYQMCSKIFRSRMERVKKATTSVAAVYAKDLLPLPLALPPLVEQERIVAEVERRLSVVDQLEAVVTANLKRADRLRQAILKDAFAGRLVPQDPADEPARALLERIRAERAAAQASPKTTRKTPGTRTAQPRKENADVSHGHQGGAGAGVPSGNARREPGTADKAPLPPDLFSANGG